MQNWTQRFAESGLLEQLCDETVALAIKQKLVSVHTIRCWTGRWYRRMRHKKSCVPIKVFLKPEDYTQWIRSPDQDPAIQRSRFTRSRARTRRLCR